MVPFLLSPENTLIQHAVMFILSSCYTMAVKVTAQGDRKKLYSNRELVPYKHIWAIKSDNKHFVLGGRQKFSYSGFVSVKSHIIRDFIGL